MFSLKLFVYSVQSAKDCILDGSSSGSETVSLLEILSPTDKFK